MTIAEDPIAEDPIAEDPAAADPAAEAPAGDGPAAGGSAVLPGDALPSPPKPLPPEAAEAARPLCAGAPLHSGPGEAALIRGGEPGATDAARVGPLPPTATGQRLRRYAPSEADDAPGGAIAGLLVGLPLSAVLWVGCYLLLRWLLT